MEENINEHVSDKSDRIVESFFNFELDVLCEIEGCMEYAIKKIEKQDGSNTIAYLCEEHSKEIKE